MTLLIGIILFFSGLCLMVMWWPSILIALQGILVVTLLLWGVIVTLIGYSEKKAQREYQAAVTGDAQATDAATDAESAPEARTHRSSILL